MTITLSEYAFSCSLLLFFLYVFFINRSRTGKRNVKEKPKISPMTLFKGTNGLPDEKIRAHFKVH